MSKYARKVDGNQTFVVSALLQVGCEVEDLSAAGRGFPDLVVQLGGRVYLMEIKNPAGKNRLTEAQIKFNKRFPVHVVRSAEEAIRVVTKNEK